MVPRSEAPPERLRGYGLFYFIGLNQAWGWQFPLRDGKESIGIVVDKRGPSGAYMIVHNVGYGPKMEDELFSWKIIGHYRYQGPRTKG